jgi:predicted cobalt transporter CbtA
MVETPEQPEQKDGRPDRPGPDALSGVRDMTEETAQRLVRAIEGSHPVRAIRGSQVATAVVGTIGFALFLVGIENAAADIPIIENGWGAMVVGLILLAIAGALIRRFME